MSSPSTRERLPSWAKIAAGVVLVVTFLYAVVVAAQILAWFYFASVAVLLWLLWRFVRAHERIAAAMELRTDAGSGVDTEAGSDVDTETESSLDSGTGSGGVTAGDPGSTSESRPHETTDDDPRERDS